MNKVVEELKKTRVFYVATVENDQPRVRPFSSVTEIDGQPYLCTGNKKDVWAQMMKNPKIEISGMTSEDTWVRVTARAVRDDNDAHRAAMLADPTGPSKLYTVGDGVFEVLRLEDVKAVRYSFTKAPEVIA